MYSSIYNMMIRNFFLRLYAMMSWTHLKYFTFSVHGAVQLIQTYKKSRKISYLAIRLLSMECFLAKLWFCAFSNALVSLHGPLSPASFLMSQRTFKWNRRPLCSALISPHKAPNKRVLKRRLLMWLSADEIYLKMASLLNFLLSLIFFLAKKTITT